MLWLGNGIAGDDTHGHVDDLARFVNPATVVTVVEANRADANYEPLQENLARLRKMKDQDGQPLRVETLPMPAAGVLRRPAPARELRQFLHRQPPGAGSHVQRRATTASRSTRWPRLFPGPRSRRHRLPRSGLGLGTLHCMTQQQPA